MWVSNVNSVNESYGNALQHCVDLVDMRGERERERYATEAEQRGLAAADWARMKKTMEMIAEEMVACWRKTSENFSPTYGGLRSGVWLLLLINLASIALAWLLAWIVVRVGRWVAAGAHAGGAAIALGVMLFASSQVQAQLFKPDTPNTTVVPKTTPSQPIPQVDPLPIVKFNPYILPPKQYDHPYTEGTLTIEEVDSVPELLAVCKLKQARALGCAFPRAGSCRIVLVRESVIKSYNWTRALMLRHEIGHCNGWPGDHPGVRRYDADGDTIATRPDGREPAAIFYAVLREEVQDDWDATQ